MLALTLSLLAQKEADDRRANTPIEPFRVIGNIYYVGAAEVTSFLITTPKGHILLDGGYAETAPQIKANIAKLGFKLEGVKFLLNSQSHFDHAGGLAEMKRLTKAKMISSVGDKWALENGGKDDFQFGDRLAYDPVTVDRVIKDGEDLKLGGVSLKAVITPGHTKGCTTWTMDVTDNRKSLKVIFVCSTTAPGYKFIGNDKYPNIVADYERTFSVLKNLRPDVFLASHGSFFELLEKAEKVRTSTGPNPFIDPKAYDEYITTTEKSFREKLAREKLPNN
jgi:metallo-beta-lactamase class B